MTFIVQALWAAMVLFFLVGGVAYAFDRHTGIKFLKNAAVLLVIIVVGPSLMRSAFNEVPGLVWLLLIAAGSVAAYWRVSHGKPSGHKSSSGASHAERHPHVPHGSEHE